MPNGHDKNWIRLCAAIDGFKNRFKHWPTKVLLPKDILYDLEEVIFMPESMLNIREKITLVVADEPVVAQDEDGNQYSYGDEGFPKRRPRFNAAAWLGVSPDRPEGEEVCM
jgi:hypothetical protein